MMRAFIVGQKWLGSELLKQCIADGVNVVGVSAPGPGDRLFDLADARGIFVSPHAAGFDPATVVGEPDILLSAGAHCFIPESARSAARFGALGYHPSLLPLHRGRSAIEWAIHMRERVAGGTIYWMDDGADTGPIALQGWCHIRPDDTAAALWQRELGPLGLKLFRQSLALLASGALPAIPQDEALATFEPAMAARRFKSAA